MKRILLLTKNILAEELLVTKLQQLNYEVFCSASILRELLTQDRLDKLIDYFPVLIIGESISKIELTYFLKRLNKQKKTILRVEDDPVNREEEWPHWQELGVKGWISPSDSIDVLREQLAKSYTPPPEKYPEYLDSEQLWDALEKKGDFQGLTLINLSVLEMQALEELCSQPGKIVSRDELCQALWGEVSPSRLAQLSSLIKSVRVKLHGIDPEEALIQTVWGKGYRVLRDFKFKNRRF